MPNNLATKPNRQTILLCTNYQEPIENATPAAVNGPPRDVTTQPPTSAFRNVSYQRATHDSMMGDSAVNQSPVDDATDAGQARPTAAAPNTASETDRTTVNNSEVRQLLAYLGGRR